jgi:tRNA pseudouridine55 synthase
MDGLLLVDKPSGPTSFDVVRATRRATGTPRVGHAGTLDPLATGLLVVCLGTHTRLVPYLMAGGKRYEARVALGCGTDTDDGDGQIVARAAVPALTPEIVRGAAAAFLGEVAQRPPAYSALKLQGQAAYRRARRGEAVDLAPRKVLIHAIEVVAVGGDELRLDVRCGAGTYIRALARDLAIALGTVGHVAALRRTEASGFDVAQALPVHEIEALAARGELEPLLRVGAAALPYMPRLQLGDEDATAIACGKAIPLPGELADAPHVALFAPGGALLAIARVEGDQLRSERGFPRPSSPAHVPEPSSPALLPGGEGGN